MPDRKWDSLARITRVFLRVAEVALVLSALAIILSTFFVTVLQVRGTGNGFEKDDVLIAAHHVDFTRGDTVAFFHGNRILVRSAIAIAGDEVDVLDNGHLAVNGIESPAALTPEDLARSEVSFPSTVPEGGVLVVIGQGDTSALHEVVGEDFVGRVVLQVWPVRSWGRV
ncbi:MAG: hypothetical protein E7L06_07655 [Schaalia turicensis]|nr:hypothetical protein [Schaalia turicensis]